MGIIEWKSVISDCNGDAADYLVYHAGRDCVNGSFINYPVRCKLIYSGPNGELVNITGGRVFSASNGNRMLDITRLTTMGRSVSNYSFYYVYLGPRRAEIEFDKIIFPEGDRRTGISIRGEVKILLEYKVADTDKLLKNFVVHGRSIPLSELDNAINCDPVVCDVMNDVYIQLKESPYEKIYSRARDLSDKTARRLASALHKYGIKVRNVRVKVNLDERSLDVADEIISNSSSTEVILLMDLLKRRGYSTSEFAEVNRILGERDRCRNSRNINIEKK